MRTIACPCGYQHPLSLERGDGYVTVRDRDWLTVLDTELACREISGSWAAMVPESNPRSSEFNELTWRIVDRCGNLLECPKCGRILWNRPGNKNGPLFQVFVPENREIGGYDD